MRHSTLIRRAAQVTTLLTATAIVALAGAAAATVLHAAGPKQDEDPPWYQKRGTWVETLEASRDAFAKAARRPDARRATLPDFGKDDFSVTAWIRTKKGGTILAKAPAEGNWAPQGKTFFVRGGRLAYDIGWVGQLAGTANVADGRWHHVALVKNGKALRLLVDGRRDKEGSLAGKPDVPDHVVKLGDTSANFPRPQSAFTGDLDEVCLFARALSDGEVRAAMAGVDPKSAKGLAACWPFEDGLADATGRDHDAAAAGRVETVEGKVGKALRLDGKTRAVVGGEAGFARVWPLLARDFPGIEPLFDGRSLEGWRPMNHPGHASGAAWEVVDGAIDGVQELPGSVGMLVTRQAFGDVDLHLQVRCDRPAEAAVLLRTSGFEGGWEVTLRCRDGGDVGGVKAGGLFDAVHAKAEGWIDAWKNGDWNDLRITVEGDPPVIRTYLNGKPMTTFKASGVTLDDPPPARGPIALKIAGDEPCFNHHVRFRYIRVEGVK